ncbi:hypothetical protein [Bacillus atrophaeus]|uniref:hypothetical protein n=1 Tax=Bacillus atrophaeus TaxID=1452 RepID=UPI002281B17F|nr:hypothetical protein [Bacillus atrophaeus]MCY8521806.1 hypothetical protein [Bacillus atrophaeus]MCY8527078.1 hypothetical protein [Bacillus atrophaeus]MDL5142714.1 hypothetical protein [Bacillus atrophaeus]
MRYPIPCYYVNPSAARLYRDASWRPPAYPSVNTASFIRSAKDAAGLLADAQLVIYGIAASPELSRRIIAAAQESKTETVKRLIRQTGVKSNLDVSFNPDGIHISLLHSRSRFVVALQWS